MSINRWIKNMWYIYTMKYYSLIKKNEIMPFAATWIDLETIILSEVNQTKTNIWYHLHVESKNMIQMNVFTKQKLTHWQSKQTYGFWRGKWRERAKLWTWDEQICIIVCKIYNQKGPAIKHRELYSTCKYL